MEVGDRVGVWRLEIVLVCGGWGSCWCVEVGDNVGVWRLGIVLV